MVVENLEYRNSGSDVSAAEKEKDKMLVEGYLIKFGHPTFLYRDKFGRNIYEVYDAGCVDARTDMDDVVMRYNHNDDCQILARTANKTLGLTVDDVGVKVRADIAPTTQGKDIYSLIERRDITAMSAGFAVDASAYDIKNHTRHIKHISLIRDASVVDQPAYKSTEVDVVRRSIEAVEKAETDKRRRELIIKTYF